MFNTLVFYDYDTFNALFKSFFIYLNMHYSHLTLDNFVTYDDLDNFWEKYDTNFSGESHANNDNSNKKTKILYILDVDKVNIDMVTVIINASIVILIRCIVIYKNEIHVIANVSPLNIY